MIKKIVVLFLVVFLTACVAQERSYGGKSSKAYSFFKKFNSEKYYVSFWDRNTSINDDTKIIMARDGDKYYYEFDGYEKNIIIQKDGKRYTVNNDRGEYFVSNEELQDFSIGILPSDVLKLKRSDYKTGTERIYNKNYVYESFSDGPQSTTYYFKGNKLIYIRYISVRNTVFLKFNYMKDDFSSEIFEISKDFVEITY